MIKINGDIVTINKFPDGTPRVNIDTNNIEEDSYDGSPCIWIEWIYESNDEMFYLMLVRKHLERFFTNVNYYLSLPYIPNARMDRVKNDDEVFTLKYFCDFINWLGFSSVYVLDAHSDVSTALLNNCVKENPKEYVDKAISKIGMRNLLFPLEVGMGLIEKYEKRKLRYEKQLSQMSDDSELSEYGFWDKGYLRGKIVICDDIIDDLNNILIGKEN